MITKEMIVKNWSTVVAPKVPNLLTSAWDYERTYGANRSLVSMLPKEHRGIRWNKRRGGWCSRVPVISTEAAKLIRSIEKAGI